MSRDSCCRTALVSVLFLLFASAATGFSLEQYRNAGYLPRGTEIPELGDEHSQHFSNGDGTIRAVIDASGGSGRGSPLALDSMPCTCSGFSELGYSGGLLHEAVKHTDPYVGSYYCGYWGVFYPYGTWILERGWVEWDVSSIPDDAQITNVVCRTYCMQIDGAFPQVQLYGMTNRPSSLTADAATLYTDAGGGSLYGGYTAEWQSYSSVTLSAAARTVLQSVLGANWFAIGYTGTGPTIGGVSWEIALGHHTGAFPPRLVVDYALPYDATTVSVDAPTGTIYQGQTYQPQATVRNDGANTITFNVKCSIPGTGYVNRKQVTSLAPTSSTPVTFDDWIPGAAGGFTVRCSTELTDDGDNQYDLETGTVTVEKRDAECVSIDDLPATVNLGQTVQPRATVRNKGSAEVSISARLYIADGAGYEHTAAVSVPSGETRQLTFPDWVANIEDGPFDVRCTTELEYDCDNSTDKQTGSVFVQTLDARTVSVDVPSGTVDQGTHIAPQATIRNNGNTTQTITARFKIEDGSGYEQTVSKFVLPSAESIYVFPEWVADYLGTDFAVTCSTELEDDMDPDNDFGSGTVTVVLPPLPDIAATAIVAPTGEVERDTEVIPQATYANEGNVETGFEAWFIMSSPTDGEVYREQVSVSALAVSEETTVVFPGWNVGEVLGEWAVRCSCYAAGDVDPADDWEDGTFDVTRRFDWPAGWHEVEPMPFLPTAKPVKYGGWLAVGPDAAAEGQRDKGTKGGSAGIGSGHSAPRFLDPSNPVIYAAKGYKTTDFYKYLPVEDTWCVLADIPANEEYKPGRIKTKPGKKGCKGVSDGTEAVYMTRGANLNGFWRYDIGADTWGRLEDVPEGPSGKRVKYGNDMVYVFTEDTGWIYLLKGYKTEFFRYNTVSGEWDTTLPEVPYTIVPKYKNGSFLVYDGDNTIYAHQARYYDKSVVDPRHSMFKYDIAAGEWQTTPLKGIPVYGLEKGKDYKKKKSKDGACGAWYNGRMYAFKGGNTHSFWEYYPANDSWNQLREDTLPQYTVTTGKKRRVKNGADLVSYEGGALFALKGNKTLEMWRYGISTLDAPSSTPRVRSGATAGGDIVHRPSFIVSPNPVISSFATLKMSGQAVKWSSGLVRVFDIAGRCVLTRPLGHSTTGLLLLDCRRLSSGVYLVRLDAGGYSVADKLVVQK